VESWTKNFLENLNGPFGTSKKHLFGALGHKPEELGEAVEDEQELEVQLVEAPAQVDLLVVDVGRAHLLAQRHQLLVGLDRIQALKRDILGHLFDCKYFAVRRSKSTQLNSP
jgi:hypothetical protein